MEHLSKLEKEGLIQATRNILTYKLMQAKGYALLAVRANEERTGGLLKDLHLEEKKDAEFWIQQLQTLGVSKQTRLRSAFEFRVRLMMGILGARGFFEWAMIAEDESVEELLILAGNLQEDSVSEAWVRAASDERLHLSRMKQDVLGMEAWEMGSGGGVRDVVFGANDGLVSILALVAGVDSKETIIRGGEGGINPLLSG
jgi:hypothetical protein